MDIEIVDGVDRLVDLRPEWDELALRSSTPSIYNTFDYTLCSWEHFDSHHSSLKVLTVRDGEQLVGLLPLRLRRRLRGLEVVLEQAATVEVDRVSLLARAGTEVEVWQALLPAIDQLSWDVWQSAEVQAGAPFFNALGTFVDRNDRFRVSEEHAGNGLLIDLSETWPDFLGRHKSFRKRLKKFERLVPDHEIDLYTSPSEILEGLHAYRQVDSRSWKAGRIGMSKSDRAGRFFDDLMPRLAADGRTAIRILRDGDELLAADLTHTFSGTAFLHSAVYTEDAAPHSPGTVFTGLVLRDFMKTEVELGDLLTGHADYLRPWTSGEVATYNVTIARDNLKNLTLAAPRHGMAGLRRLRETRGSSST